jgi:hypothetical protein
MSLVRVGEARQQPSLSLVHPIRAEGMLCEGGLELADRRPCVTLIDEGLPELEERRGDRGCIACRTEDLDGSARVGLRGRVPAGGVGRRGGPVQDLGLDGGLVGDRKSKLQERDGLVVRAQ